MLTYVIIYDLVDLFVIPVTLLFFFVQKNIEFDCVIIKKEIVIQ
jgi:hypothetical protein